MADRFEVAVGAETLRLADEQAVRFPHRLIPEGVAVRTNFTGAHLLHLAAAGCVLNDLYREAATLGIQLTRVQVSAAGGFNTQTWHSTGIQYSVQLDSPAPAEQLTQLLHNVAEIPRAIRAGAPVQRTT